MTKIHAEPFFKGLKIKCNNIYRTLQPILEAQYVLTFKTSKRLSRPLGFHCVFRLTPKAQLSEISNKLTMYYKGSGYNPPRVTCKEMDDDGSHYHMAIAIDGRHNTKSSLSHFFSNMKKKGLVTNYKVIAPNDRPFGYNLSDEKEAISFFDWMSYSAKTDTKDIGKQTHSMDKQTQADLRSWKEARKPALISPTKSDELKPTNSFNDLSDFIDGGDIKTLGFRRKHCSSSSNAHSAL